jgi:hypothetical protein
MPSTYSQIATVTANGSTATYTFSSIPSIYTNLVLICGSLNGTANFSPAIRFNGDTATNYSGTYLEGNGSSASSARNSSQNAFYNGAVIGYSSSVGTSIFQVNNYNNTTTFKTVLGRNNYNGTGLPGTSASVGLWRSTSAITSMTIFIGSGNFTSGSTFTLYGIKGA